MRKSKLNKMSVATGKAWESDDEQKPLNKLESFASLSASAEEYKNQLNSMNSFDLQKHAIEVGEAPRDNRDILIKNLLKRFKE